MLLSFPLDPDPSTVERRAARVHRVRDELDGRRFAAEFVTRRKADAAAARAARARAPASAADVLRAQPKAAPGNEWGAFKVVNKKKKGGK
jgi:PERQ amino acid-rich with GYF domain-containing protein